MTGEARTPADHTGEVALAELIWRTSRADEGAISATGADHLARTIIDAGWTAADAESVAGETADGVTVATCPESAGGLHALDRYGCCVNCAKEFADNAREIATDNFRNRNLPVNADDAGEVDRLKASLLEPANRRAARLGEQRDEARAEADRLRDAATAMESAWSICDDDRNDAEMRLAAVGAIVSEWDDGHEGVSRRFCPSCVRADRLRAALSSIDDGKVS